jgi:AcrR family transcriptional regulator
MTTLTPKQREIQERETKILEVARPIVVREGYHGLNMDRIAEKISYSKGTIYNHFSCKEEIIIALAVQNVAKRIELFRQAAQFKGRPRYRMMAILEAAEIFATKFSDYFQFEQILVLDSVREKTSEKRRMVIQNCEMQCMSVVSGIVRDAIASGDLELPKHITPEKLVYGLWSLTTGAYSIALTSDSLPQIGVEEPFAAVRDQVAIMLDGYRWKPLSTKVDRLEILMRIREEVFSNE